MTEPEKVIWDHCDWDRRIEWLATEWTRRSLAATEREVIDKMSERVRMPLVRPLPSWGGAAPDDPVQLGPCWDEERPISPIPPRLTMRHTQIQTAREE